MGYLVINFSIRLGRIRTYILIRDKIKLSFITILSKLFNDENVFSFHVNAFYINILFCLINVTLNFENVIILKSSLYFMRIKVTSHTGKEMKFHNTTFHIYRIY